MYEQIEAIFFDMGGTLRTRIVDEELRQNSLAELMAVLEVQESPAAFYQCLTERARAYKKWATATLIEAPVEEIWTHWMLPEHSPERIAPLAERLTRLWRGTQGRRIMRPEADAVLAALERRGYHLGLISNTTSREVVPTTLEKYGLVGYFPVVVLSSTFGRRKPDPAIFLEGTRRLGVSPARSAYVGDQISRDVLGARQAGFAVAILIENPGWPQKDRDDSLPAPDATIHDLSELLPLFSGT